ncbi:c-type cytochrome [Sagittula stellata]|uniref:Cytochrome c family protein n=1 Tax=Sagittula stellata (strain ATCC 700073 / DSM 11524 / E-37) TaxID=388399 RepID=A3K6B7_SAGS3|nr:c-type cytochrome [Sagittula stellata]EBA07267.1 cytochrome c family protein [Sagittula stellata E-37]
MARILPTLALLLAAAPAFADTFEEVKVAAGKTLFDAECRRCHAPNATDPSYGPPLENVLNRAAGSVGNYDYSIALEASGIVWTPAALRAWMEDNDGFMPGTKMRHVGIEDRTVQDFILAYLASISPQDNTAVDGE